MLRGPKTKGTNEDFDRGVQFASTTKLHQLSREGHTLQLPVCRAVEAITKTEFDSESSGKWNSYSSSESEMTNMIETGALHPEADAIVRHPPSSCTSSQFSVKRQRETSRAGRVGAKRWSSKVLVMSTGTAAAVILCLTAAVTFAEANFFSRVVKFDTADERKAPSGAANAMGSEAQVGSVVLFEDGVPYAHLANSNRIPLVGQGVGNLQHDLIVDTIKIGLEYDRRIRLIDTAHASKNEHLVAQGINEGIEHLKLRGEPYASGKTEVHVVTKIWYTHLGYERSKIAVLESLEALRPAIENPSVELHLHVLLHWPRCFDNIPWMNCAQDEQDLPQYVKDAGPDPYSDPEKAWQESWKLLEDMYLSDQYPIASIGISNFHLHDIEMFDSFARIHPHVLQVNIWSLLYDPMLVEYCHKHRTHIQVYNAIAGTVSQPERAPRAYHHIQKVAYEIADDINYEITPAQVILAWLIQHGVSVVPRTSRVERLDENSAVAVAAVPALTDLQVETIAHAVEAYLSGDDLEQDIHVSVSFHAVSKDIMLYWLGHDGSEVRIGFIEKGQSFKETTYPNHRFRTYLASNKDIYTDHEVIANFGDHRNIHVEL
jgi:diketogulonate reductase-like aldo/keto reductase